MSVQAARPAAAETQPTNLVVLSGRLAAPPVAKQLQSGDCVVTFRLVVDRPRGHRPPSVDTIDCAVWRSALQRRVLGWQPGDSLSVEGQLRRRFWRGAGGLGSRYEVEVGAARRARATAADG